MGLLGAIFGGGDSTSTTSQTTTVDYTDSRQVNTTNVDSRSTTDSSIKTANSNNTSTSNTNIAVSDYGAIAASLKNNSQNSVLVFALADSLSKQGASVLDKNLSLAKDLASGAKSAYSDAAMQSSGTKNLVLVGMIIAGVVGAVALAK